MRDIKGFNGKYLIDEDGNIYSKYTNKFISQRENQKGYKIVDLYINNKRKQLLVHRLVAETFIPNLHNYPCVNHKDENVRNNNVDNLEWCTYKYNLEYSKIIEKANNSTKKKVARIDKNTLKIINIFDSTIDAQKRTGIHNGNICECCKGKRKTAGGYIWKRIEQ